MSCNGWFSLSFVLIWNHHLSLVEINFGLYSAVWVSSVSLCRIKTLVSWEIIIITKSQCPRGIVKVASKDCCLSQSQFLLTATVPSCLRLNAPNISCNPHDFSHNFKSIKICWNYFSTWKDSVKEFSHEIPPSALNQYLIHTINYQHLLNVNR